MKRNWLIHDNTGRYWLVFGGDGSVWGRTGWCLVVLGQYNWVLRGIKWSGTRLLQGFYACIEKKVEIWSDVAIAGQTTDE